MVAPNCIIFDIDGTLADLRHRLHYIKGTHKDYEAFYDALVDDEPIKPVASLLDILSSYQDEYEIVFVSGRPDSHEEHTRDWLDDFCNYSGDRPLYMRKAGDYRPDDVVKREILAELRTDGYEPLLVIDDRPRVVEMWRSEGVFCLQCPWHEDDAPAVDVEGKTLLTMMVGPSGAGKSTWCKENFPPSWVVSSDEIRWDLTKRVYDPSDNPAVWHAVHTLAKTRTSLGLPAVIDATNLRRRDRLACLACAPKGSVVEYIVINRPVADKLATLDWRNPTLIHQQEQRFNSGIRDILAGDNQPNVKVSDMRKK